MLEKFTDGQRHILLLHRMSTKTGQTSAKFGFKSEVFFLRDIELSFFSSAQRPQEMNIGPGHIKRCEQNIIPGHKSQCNHTALYFSTPQRAFTTNCNRRSICGPSGSPVAVQHECRLSGRFSHRGMLDLGDSCLHWL